MRSLSETLGLGPFGEPGVRRLSRPIPRRPRVLLRGERAAGRRFPLAHRRSIGPPSIALGDRADAWDPCRRGGRRRGARRPVSGLRRAARRARRYRRPRNSASASTSSRSPASRISTSANPGARRHQPEELPAVLRRRRGARQRLEADPLVKEASVRKLYPNRLVIDIVERTPVALWQKDGEVRADRRRRRADRRRARRRAMSTCPSSSATAPTCGCANSCAARRRGGTAAATSRPASGRQRRWNLKMKTGVDVKLPETDPAARDRDAARARAPVAHSRARHTRARPAHARPGLRAAVAEAADALGAPPTRQRRRPQP